MSDDHQSVRPIGVEQPDGHHPPRLPLVIALLAIGGLIGWGIASLGGDSIATATTTTLAAESSPLGDASLAPGARPTVSWVAADSLPAVPENLDFAGATDPVELNGSIYLVVSYSSGTSPAIRNELWSSADGSEWVSTPIELDENVAVVDITAIPEGLLLAGSGDSVFGLWRSVPGRSLGGSSWVRIPTETPPGFTAEFHSTAVNRGNEIVTTVIGDLAIWREVIAPYLPDEIDLADPGVRFSSGVVYTSDGQTIEPFREPPEVLTVDGTVWIRLVARDGNEILQTRELPPGAYPVETSPDLSFVPVAMSWRSEDGVDFLPVTGRNALPNGYFLPEAWEGDFVAASYQLRDAFAANEEVTLWRTSSGRAWQRSDDQPPRECSPYFFAVSRSRLLLVGPDGIRCIWAEDEWTVLAEPGVVAFVVGGPAGFLGYPDVFEFGTAVFSRDGVTWSDVDIPANEPSPSLSILSDRLFALSVAPQRPSVPQRIEIWLGTIQ
ncbi:MAG: hypothetical protein QNJ81_08260 [Acidimicrobiia bacterium]|nr:hypothetical protein [Acidimicrobiia bacterium]